MKPYVLFTVLWIPALLFSQGNHASPVTGENGSGDGIKGKSDGRVLHPNLKVINIDADKTQLAYKQWNPSKEELDAAELEGVVKGKEILHNPIPSNGNHVDYINISRPLTFSTGKQRSGSLPAVIETLVVVDKEFADKFQHDRVKILNYLTVYFWDLNMRYKTLPSVDISFRITGVTIISTTSAQPFIEEARAGDGRAEFGRILYRFVDWLGPRRATFPKYDVAVLITSTNLEWGGGLAFVSAACAGHGAAVFNDGGDWGSITVGAHEIAHIVGAPHDEDICSAKGYIMSGGNEELKWFFSTCSDQMISNFVRSDQGACLRTIDEWGGNPISPDFSSALPPTMLEQCRSRFGPQAWMDDDLANCKHITCKYPGGPGWYYISNVEATANTPCADGGRCFRGRCRKPGSLITNVGSGMCMRAPNQFAFTVALEMVNCNYQGTPLDRFLVSDKSYGKTLATPWQSVDASENGDRCAYTGNAEGDGIFTDRCSDTNPWHGWDFIDVGNGQFMLSHRISGRCAQQNGKYINTYGHCDRNNVNMRWRLQ